MTQAVEAAVPSLQCLKKPCRRILVVEDDRNIRQINAMVLNHSGYEVDTAEDGNAGWKALHAVRHAPDCYDLLITDHNMPGLTGVALVKKLRDVRMMLPVIMATGTLPSEDFFTRYPWFQPAAVLMKPYTIKELLGMVEAVLHKINGAHVQIAPPANRQCRPSAVGLQP